MTAGGTWLWFLAFGLVFPLSAQPPGDYYSEASGKRGMELQQALHTVIAPHTVLPYDTLVACFEKSDRKPDSTVWDMYSDVPGGIPAYLYFFGAGMECGNYKREGDCYNREHSFPKSWFNDRPPMNSDLFHIYPTDGYVNNRRGNYPFGETADPSWSSTNGSRVGPSSRPGYSGIVFEPIDEYKGDFARTCFYMATRYLGEDSGWKGSDMVTGAEPRPWAREMLLDWHRLDTVSLKERNRNEEVFRLQHNRNPFIDFPGFAMEIWGNTNIAEGLAARPARLVIFPNPAEQWITVKTGEQLPAEIRLSVYDAAGSLRMRISSRNPGISLPVGDLPSGFYLVKTESEGVFRCGSFIKR